MEVLVGAFIDAFPAQARFGKPLLARQLGEVMEREGLYPAEVFKRIRGWARLRKDMQPRDLAKAPPQSRKQVDLPADVPAREVKVEQVSECVAEIVRRMKTPWEGEDV